MVKNINIYGKIQQATNNNSYFCQSTRKYKIGVFLKVIIYINMDKVLEFKDY